METTYYFLILQGAIVIAQPQRDWINILNSYQKKKQPQSLVSVLEKMLKLTQIILL